MTALYATLGLAPALAGALRSQNLLGAVFVLGFALVVATILTMGLATRPSGRNIAVALGIVAAYLLVIVRVSLPERSHLIEYGVVGVFIHEALLERAKQGRRVPWPGPLAMALTILLGVVDECIQAVLPSREFSWQDILFDVLAATFSVSASAALHWGRRRR